MGKKNLNGDETNVNVKDKFRLERVKLSEKIDYFSNRVVTSVSKWDTLTKGMAIATVLVGAYGMYAMTTAIANTPRGYNVYDKNLRISFYMPYDWNTVVPKGDEIYDVAKASSDNTLFDLMVHPLKEEVVPFAFSRGEKEKEDEMYPSFMTMAFRGADEEYTYMKDKLKLGDDFKALLKGMKHTDIEVLSVENKTTDGFNGILLTGEGKYNKQKITYTQYFEPVGANIMIITHGTTSKLSGAGDIKSLLKDLQVMPVGAYGVDQTYIDLEDGFDQYKEEKEDDSVDAIIENGDDDNVQEKEEGK